ncbi:MAG: Gfo/Idh/MocA family oxidoreductase [Saprospiraceae bacterium]|nr:Gfo/Idh/MocA family oxidoreductase [Saprospiraceae bacterium]
MDKNKFKNGINWGIIGAGDVCEMKSAPAMNLIKGSKLRAIMRRNAEKAADFAQRHSVPKWYNDADALINDPDVNAVYISTPPDTHAFYTLKAAAAGKAVYVEKPMARTHQECLEMVAACEKAAVPLFVAYYRRELTIFKTVKQLLTEGVIGDVRFVDIKMRKASKPPILAHSVGSENWRVNPEIAGGGYFYDLGSHQLDLMDFLFGKIVSANGFAANQTEQYQAEDIVLGNFYFENGIIGQGSWCFNAPLSSETELTTIYGSQGEISFSVFSNSHITLKIEGKRKRTLRFEMPKHIQQPLIQTIVDDLHGKGKCISTGATATRTNWVMGQICQSIVR